MASIDDFGISSSGGIEGSSSVGVEGSSSVGVEGSSSVGVEGSSSGEQGSVPVEPSQGIEM